MADTDMVDSEPRRKSSILLPKPDVLLPNIEDIVPNPCGPRGSIQGPGLPSLYVPGVSDLLIDGNPIGHYKICGKSYSMERPLNESNSSLTRHTFSGRILKYTLSVLQEPLRARACGAGPRCKLVFQVNAAFTDMLASADRRPVDPPPVVQLTIIDDNTGEDVTMHYDAGFMLYASLEVARPIAQGRMHNSGHPPVLTGVAVASTAYLERPKKAGYFIFPDLSVRHEGWYRLKFSLFEAVKHAADADVDRPFVPVGDDKEVVPHQSMANRMEVQSNPFQVFSAKKFPGLSESTEIRQRKRPADAKPERQSSHPSPAPSYKSEHFRSASRTSDYYRPDFNRPTPSRNPSLAIASLLQSSPPQATPMAPPPAKYESSPMYSPSAMDFSSQLPPLRHELPPPAAMLANNFNSVTRQYDLPEKSKTKRAYTTGIYDQSSAMKAGERPDRTPPPYKPFNASEKIEADDTPEDDPRMEAPYTYPRADGGTGRKYPTHLAWRRGWNSGLRKEAGLD